MAPLYSMWWLAKRHWGGYTSVADHSSTIIEVCGADCDRAGTATLAAVVTGMLVVLLVLVADVLVPLHRDRSVAAWLKAVPFVFVPYLLFQVISSAT